MKPNHSNSDNLKECTQCKKLYPQTSYHKGKVACKSCVRAYAKGWYSRNKVKVIEQTREYYSVNKDSKNAQRRNEYYPKNREKILAQSVARNQSIRGRARQAVHYAIKKGKMVKQPCEQCGTPQAEAHHHKGYNREFWLEVQWLCRACHGLQHRQEVAV